jgi:hypothetical protein
MDFRKKLKDFISDIRDSSNKSPEDDTNVSTSQLVASARSLEHVSDYKTQDPRVDQELIDSIDPTYFNDDQSFDAIEYDLNKMAGKLDLASIECCRSVVRSQLQAVSHRVSELVLENHPAYAAELDRVMELERCLQDASDICATGRRQLYEARHYFTTASLGLLRNYRRRQQLTALLKSLRTIKTLQRTDIRLRELLEEEDYPGAIQLCLECQKAASTYKHYTCISELSSKLQDTLEMIDESMDVALSKTCGHFDEQHYTRIQTAYRLLGKTQAAIDQLHMHFTSSVHNTAFVKVLGYVELCSGTGDGIFQKRPYADLCKCISAEVFLPCLIDLCKALWELMKSYYKTIEWHRQHDVDISTDQASGNSIISDASVSTSATTPNQTYIHQKLENGLSRIWLDVQQKVKTYLLSTDLSSFKYDSFIQVLDVVNRLIQVGEEFSGGKSESLEESVRKQSLNYFRSYHRTRLDELRMFLENESWELCPVKPNFTILMLQEFKFMRQLTTETQSKHIDDSLPGHSDCVNYFVKYADLEGSPFDLRTVEDEGDDVLELNGVSHVKRGSHDSESDDDVPDELKADYVDERTGDLPPQIKPTTLVRRRSSYRSSQSRQISIVTNTTLNVCRLFGKYMQMMLVLKPIAFDVIVYMTQLFDYYLYAVYSFFVADSDTTSVDNLMSLKLRATLKRICENLILTDDMSLTSSSSPSVTDPVNAIISPAVSSGRMLSAGSPTGVDDRRDHVHQPHISPAVDLHQRETLFGLVERVVATESLMFLADQFKLLQQRLEDAIPPAKKAFLQQFFSQTLSTASELRRPVYRGVAVRSVNIDACLQMMLNVKWDIKDIMSQHSPYVDSLLQELQLFDQHLEVVSKRVPIPKAVSDALWEHLVRVSCSTFVEGFAAAKKCTNEGRALMQLDFQQFLNKLEKLTDLRPIPGREFVEVYIKAYYLPEAQLETWIHDHKEYNTKHLLALVNCLGHISKKSRQRLIVLIEDIDRLNKR